LLAFVQQCVSYRRRFTKNKQSQDMGEEEHESHSQTILMLMNGCSDDCAGQGAGGDGID